MNLLAPIGFGVVDLNHKVVEGDDAMEELLCYGRSDLIGRDALSFTYAADVATSAPAFGALIETGRGFRIAKRFVRADGEIIWTQNTVSLVKHIQGTQFVICTAARIERPRLEGRLAEGYDEAKRLCQFMVAGRAAFGDELFFAPAVEILLGLYREETEARGISVDRLARAIDVATSTTVRWVRLLQQQQLVEVEGGGAVSPNAVVRVGATCQQKLGSLLSRFGQRACLPDPLRMNG